MTRLYGFTAFFPLLSATYGVFVPYFLLIEVNAILINYRILIDFYCQSLFAVCENIGALCGLFINC